MSDEDNILKSFRFDIPVELIKSQKVNADGTESDDDDALDSWQIQGIASTNDEDLQGETVIQEGLDISPLKAGRGLFNDNHVPGITNVIGQIEDADFVTYNGKKSLLVKGYLFKHQEKSISYYNVMRSIKKGSAARVHLSIEGKILHRDPMNKSIIGKARIDKVALTLDPVNPNTFIDLIKALSEGNSDLEKTMAAGIGHAGAPEDMTGGEVTGKESLDCKTKVVTYNKKKKKFNKSNVDLIIDGIRKSFPENDPIELAKMVLARITKEIVDA